MSILRLRKSKLQVRIVFRVGGVQGGEVCPRMRGVFLRQVRGENIRKNDEAGVKVKEWQMEHVYIDW